MITRELLEWECNRDLKEQARERGFLDKKHFVFNAFTEELIGGYDFFEEAEEAMIIK